MFHAHIDGFTASFSNFDDLIAWASDLGRRYDFTGKKAQVWKAKETYRTVGVYRGAADIEFIVP